MRAFQFVVVLSLACAGNVLAQTKPLRVCSDPENMPFSNQKLEGFEAQGLPALCFVLGGPHGLDPEFEREARWQMGLSPLTLPYQLARLVLVEQLYRCETLRRWEPNNKA